MQELNTLADELGFPKEKRGGTQALLDNALEAFVWETGVLINPSPLAQKWARLHNFVWDDDDVSQPDAPLDESERALPLDEVGEEVETDETQPEIGTPHSETAPVNEPVEEELEATPQSLSTQSPDADPIPLGAPKKKPGPKPKPKLEPEPGLGPKPRQKPGPKPKMGSAPEAHKEEKKNPTAMATTQRGPKTGLQKTGQGLPTHTHRGKRLTKPGQKYTQLCTEDHLRQINSLLAERHRVEIAPLEGGPKVRDKGPFRTVLSGEGRTPIIWTEEEKALVIPFQKYLKTLPLKKLMDLLKETPIPEPQAKDLPKNSMLIDLMKTQTTGKDGEIRVCADSILRMRATILLLKAKAAEVSGRRVYY
jgi:hypothetical protein